MFRVQIRTLFETALIASGGTKLARRRSRHRAAVLAYHNIIPDEAGPTGDSSLHLPLSHFREQLDRLSVTHKIVTLDALLTPAQSESRPRAAITFDDAYRGATRLAIPELAERGLPATVFVSPGLLGEAGFWWDRVAEADGVGLDPAIRFRALTEFSGRQETILERMTGSDVSNPDLLPATPEDLAAAVSMPGMTLASHSWTHPNLTRLSEADLRDELRRPRDWLAEHHGGHATLDHLSFPYGIWDERVAETALQVGYESLYAITGGLVSPSAISARPRVLPRINVPAGVTIAGFELRTSGVLA